MKRYLKDYVLTTNKVEEAIYDCLKNKWRRKDVSYFLAEYMMNDGDDFDDKVREALNFKPKKFVSNNDLFVKKLKEYIML